MSSSRLPFSVFSQLFFPLLISHIILIALSPNISGATNNNTTSSLSHDHIEAQLISSSSSSSSTHLNPAYHTCLPEHLSALLQLKRGFNLDDRDTALSTWNASNKEHCCSWERITCNTFAAAASHVIGLNLSGLHITGVLDFQSLFHLRSLQRLDLSLNDFYASPLPPGFGQLSRLTHLHLSDCNFYGPIPTDVFHLTRLVSLDLSHSQYYDDPSEYLSLQLGSSAGLGESFRNLSNLRELHLDSVNMSALGSEWSPMLAYATNLRKLTMKECGLSGPIHPSLSRLHFLTELHLSYNYGISAPVPQFIANFTSLTSLSLSDSGFHGEFPKSIFSLPKLQNLDISGNLFLTISLPKISTNSTVLRQLRMSGTKFQGNWADFLGNFISLKYLDLSSCSILGPIPQSDHVNLSQVVHLYLSHNYMQGPIPTLISGLTQLTYLSLASNNLSGVVDLASFANLENLQSLDLSYNRFSAITNDKNSSTEASFPNLFLVFRPERVFLNFSNNNFSRVFDLSVLRDFICILVLDLSHNSLEGINDSRSNATSEPFPQLGYLSLASCNISKFPDALRNHVEMYTLDLSSNRISGKIPEWIWSLGGPGGLSYLNLSNNALEGLEGSFPHLSLKSLQFLDLSANMLKGFVLIPPPAAAFFSLASNKLGGEVPSRICEAPLKILDLSDNHFTGVIPQCLGEMSDSLAVLNLRKNSFRGTLFQPFKARCEILETLDLSNNELEGDIPKSLANCQRLTVLNVGNNRIRDAFPSHLANLPDLRVLVLRSNQFYGPIETPSSIKSQPFFPSLQIIDLSFNNLSGRLPSNLFSAWTTMKDTGSASQFLFVKSLLEGYYYQDKVTLVSKGLQLEFVKILTALTVVDLSHNQFHGDIPSCIGELKSLVVLNISHNHFQGQIPLSLANLKQLESLDLSQNSLHGKIPQQLSKLYFLEALNLSENHLSGSIPQGGQFDTFLNDSFRGNPALCGPPLSRKCKEESVLPPPPPLLSGSEKQHKSEVDFMWSGFAVGHAVGFGVFFWTMVLWRKGRHAFFEFFDRVLWSFWSFWSLIALQTKRCGA